MRLFLSSQDLGNHGSTFAGLMTGNKKVAFIKNAQDDLPEQERNFSLPEKKLMFEKIGCKFEEIDLRKYFGRQHQLEAKLKEFSAVWCSGGNTFILIRAMQASGLDNLLHKLLKSNTIVYGGSSAGSCVAAPSLEGIQFGDRPQPDIVPEDYPIKATIWEGLNLVPFMIVPHADQDWFRAQAGATIQYLKKHKIDHKILNDGQVVMVNGDEVKVLK